MQTEQTVMSRKERERQRNRQAIMDAALKLFTEHGYHAVSMSRIAAEAEFGTGTLYNFFESKKALYGEIIYERASDLCRSVRAVLDEGKDEISTLREYAHAMRREFRANALFVQLYTHVSNGFGQTGDDRLDNYITQIRAEGVVRLTELFARGQEKGVFRPLDPEKVAKVYRDTLEATTIKAVNINDDDDSDLDFLFDVFFHGILNTTEK